MFQRVQTHHTRKFRCKMTVQSKYFYNALLQIKGKIVKKAISMYKLIKPSFLPQRTGITRDVSRDPFPPFQIQRMSSTCTNKYRFQATVYEFVREPSRFHFLICSLFKKRFYLFHKISVLNIDCTIVFYVMRRTKLDPTYIYFNILHWQQVAICYIHKLPQKTKGITYKLP